MKNIKITNNPFLLFSPFLIVSVILVLIFPTHGNTGDEGRYLMFARNLIHGSYSPTSPDIDLGAGPGYPIILMPFVAVGLPLVCITILNAFFYYLSIILLFKSLLQIVTYRKALIGSLFWAFCFFNLYGSMPVISPEAFTAFLISLLLIFLVKAFNPDNSKKTKKFIYLSGFTMGFIALTKIIFGYVLLFMLIGSIVVWMFNKIAPTHRKTVLVLLIAFATTIPYLSYTYYLSGKIFYWGTTGGNNLYWMSTPYENEYGSWYEFRKLEPDSIPLSNYAPGSQVSINSNHRKDYEEILKYKGVERDDEYKRIAIINIKSHPLKFAQNCFCNIGRILFNYPYSYKIQNPGTLLRLPFNGIIVVLMIFCTIPTLVNWGKIIFPIRFILFFSFLYLGGSVLGSAEIRMFTIIVPMLLFWIAFIIKKSIKINLKFDKNTN